MKGKKMELINKNDVVFCPVMPKEYRHYQTMNLDDAYEQGWEDLQALVAKLPSIDAVPVKHGRWVPGREIGKEMLIDGSTEVVYEDYKCSSCGLILFRLLHNVDGTPFYKFCPNCGADMRGEEE